MANLKKCRESNCETPPGNHGCGSAAGVLGSALATPEIGVLPAFTPHVSAFSPEFLYPEGRKEP